MGNLLLLRTGVNLLRLSRRCSLSIALGGGSDLVFLLVLVQALREHVLEIKARHSVAAGDTGLALKRETFTLSAKILRDLKRILDTTAPRLISEESASSSNMLQMPRLLYLPRDAKVNVLTDKLAPAAI